MITNPAGSLRLAAVLVALALLGAACGDDDTADPVPAADPVTTDAATTDPVPATEPDATDTSAATSAPTSQTEAVVIDPERCAANEAAGTITYISSFDFAASAAILDPIVAEAEGFFDDVCLDVELVPGFAPSNGALVAEGQGQMSSAGSFGELVNNNVEGEADLVAVGQYGKTAIEALVLPVDGPVDADDLAGTLPGTTMGIKGDIPYSLQTLLGRLGVERGNFDELILDGFDPVAHLELGIDALPVYKSNEPAQLDAADVPYVMVDPLDFDVPSSFGIMFTSRSFLDEHPTAVQDFMRASFRAFQFGIENPEEAVGHAFELIDAAGNPNFFSTEGEGFRWLTESALVASTTPDGTGIGVIDPARLEAEIQALTDAGVFSELPDFESMYDASVAEEVYDGAELRWPA